MTLIRKVWEIHRHKRLETQTSSFDWFELKAECEFIELIWIKACSTMTLVMSIKSFVYDWSMKFLMVFILEFCSWKLMNRLENQMGSPFLLLPKDQAWMKTTVFQVPKSKTSCKLVFQKLPYFSCIGSAHGSVYICYEKGVPSAAKSLINFLLTTQSSTN